MNKPTDPASRPTKRQSQAQKTKRKLYEAGIRAINEQGFHAVTVEDITTA